MAAWIPSKGYNDAMAGGREARMGSRLSLNGEAKKEVSDWAQMVHHVNKSWMLFKSDSSWIKL